jgi:hypothetical protein
MRNFLNVLQKHEINHLYESSQYTFISVRFQPISQYMV